MGNLLGEPFEKYVDEQIKVRQKVYGNTQDRTPNEISYLNSRNAWVRLSSGVSIEDYRFDLLKKNNDQLDQITSGRELAKEYVLFNGTTTYTDNISNVKNVGIERRGILTPNQIENKLYHQPAYGVGGLEQGFSPMPGILGADVKDLNRGSLKQAKINIKCHNRNQLDIIDVLYMRLGYSVLLEWGNNVYINNKTKEVEELNPTFLQNFLSYQPSSKVDQYQILKKISDERKKWCGNYDALFGRVTNFTWKFNTDGSYDVTLTVTSVGDIIESLKINLPVTDSSVPTYTAAASNSTLQSLIENYQDEPVPLNDFYNTLFPGLESQVEAYYNQMKSDGFQKVFGNFTKSFPSFNGNYTLLDVGYTQVGEVIGTNNPLYPTALGWTPFDTEFEYQRSAPIPSFTNPKSSLQDIINEILPNPTPGETDNWVSEFFNDYILDNLDERWPNQYLIKVHNSNDMNDYTLQFLEMVDPDFNEEFDIPLVIASGGSGNFTQGGKQSSLIQSSPNVRSSPTRDWSNIQNGFFILNQKYSHFAKGMFEIPAFYDPLTYPGNTGLAAVNTIDDPIDRGPLSFFEMTRKQKDVASDVLFTLGSLDHFKEYIYNLFVDEDYAGTDDDPRFELPDEEDDSEEEEEGAEEFKTILEEKKNKNKIFRWLYDVRKFYPIYEAGSDQTSMHRILPALESLKKVALYNFHNSTTNTTDYEEIGYVLNPQSNINRNNAITGVGKMTQDQLEAIVELVSLNNQDSTEDEFKSSDENLAKLIKQSQLTQDEIMKVWNDEVKYPIYNSSTTSLVDFVFLKVNPLENSYFVRLGTLLKFLERKVIPKFENSDNPLFKIDVDPKKNICYAIDNSISTDMRKCIICNSNFFTRYIGNYPQYHEILQGLNPFLKTYNEYVYGELMNVYFNFSRIEQIIESVDENNNIDLFTFLKALCDDINECLGGVNNIEPVIDKENNTIKLIDQTPIPGIGQIAQNLGYSNYSTTPTTLEVFGYNQKNKDNITSNFVHNIGLVTEISKEYASMITIGATANGALPGSESTAFSSWNIGLQDVFKDNIIDSSASTGSLLNQSKRVIDNYAGFCKNRWSRLGLNKFEKDIYTINEEFINLNKDTVNNYYTYYQGDTMAQTLENPLKTNLVESSIGFLPFNLKIDMDGLSGIKIYNNLKVNTSFLPTNYGNSLDFIITGVNHKLQNNQWVTSLETLATSTYKK